MEGATVSLYDVNGKVLYTSIAGGTQHTINMSKSMRKPIKIVFDASPLLVNKTGVAYYTERLIMNIAQKYPDDVELVGYYFNFLGRRSSAHFPSAPNIRFHGVYFWPSKVLYQLRRWNIEIPVEFLSHTKADFILFTNFPGWTRYWRTISRLLNSDTVITKFERRICLGTKRVRSLRFFAAT